MKIVVCIKRVPDTESRIRIGGDKTSIDTAGLKYIISPYDEFALEAALRLKEAKGEGEIVAVSVGESNSGEQLRSALAMGADRAVLLKGQPSFDGTATAKALAAEIKAIAPDLVLCGMKSVDDDQQQVGTMSAEYAGLPSVSVVAEFEIEGDKVVAHREVDGGVEIVEVAMPALITMTKGKHEPRYPSLKGIMAAKKKPLEEKDAQLGVSRVTVRELTLPAERAAGKIVGQGADAVPELMRLLKEEAKVL
ncbi:MAG TPA: electron transfer flavoprotein subunit beta/FixA family protein [Longimicrobiales bacterium]|nr:electron transfer flavoprotein subunit beta/FixA family protein [Longimicrobiales bacterium]